LIALAGFMACYKSSEKLPADEYQLVWSDEFDYTGLPDSTKWSYDTTGNATGWGNHEWQNYTSHNFKNAFVDSNYLHIVAIKEKMGNKDYTSARLVTSEKGDWLYGKIDVRAKLPHGLGTWPAIWMLSTDWEYGGWPESGEIDIMEHVGYMIDSVFASAHTKTYNHVIGTQKTKGFAVNSEQEFHNYILEWDTAEYSVYVDTTKYFTFKNEHKTPYEWPFDKRFHLLLNLAVGGNWGAVQGVDTTIFPVEMLVDYVRVYQK
jgi:beta-glucanase (GH16 family)